MSYLDEVQELYRPSSPEDARGALSQQDGGLSLTFFPLRDVLCYLSVLMLLARVHTESSGECLAHLAGEEGSSLVGG